jgi:signal transduction histidine kinase
VERPPPAGDAGPDGAQALDLVEAARRAVHLLEPECRRRGVQPGVQADAPVVVTGDPVAVDQIVHNLLMNALQAMDAVNPGQRRLHLTLRRDGAVGELTVADRGPGIAPEALPRLFEPFFSTREGGLGLGLSLCETLAQGMGGSLGAANRPGGGAEFTLRLPLKDTA